jgi:hypothetical protein
MRLVGHKMRRRGNREANRDKVATDADLVKDPVTDLRSREL